MCLIVRQPSIVDNRLNSESNGHTHTNNNNLLSITVGDNLPKVFLSALDLAVVSLEHNLKALPYRCYVVDRNFKNLFEY